MVLVCGFYLVEMGLRPTEGGQRRIDTIYEKVVCLFPL